MARVMPSQVVQTIDEMFPNAKKNGPDAMLSPGRGSQLLGILNLLKEVPDKLIALPPADYSGLILRKKHDREHWRARGPVGNMAHVKGSDAPTVIRRVLAKCSRRQPNCGGSSRHWPLSVRLIMMAPFEFESGTFCQIAVP